MRWELCSWSDEAERELKDALGEDGEIIRGEVEAGSASLWRIEGHGYFVTRLEKTVTGSELVMVAWQGVDTFPVVEHLQAVARNQGIDSIRFHTAHPEKLAGRFVAPLGFKRVETVFRWDCNGQ